MKQLVFLFALAMVFGSVGTGRADPTFIESRLTLKTEAQVLPDPVQYLVSDRHSTGGYADQTASATSSSSTSNGTAIALASARTIWESSKRGQVVFDNIGFVQAILNPSGMADVNDSIWYYTFTNGKETEFKLDYAIGIGDSTDEIVGIQGFSFEVDQNGETVYVQDFDLNSSGTIAVPLDPFQTYTVKIIPNGGFQSDDGLGISSMWGDFAWAIKKSGHDHRIRQHGIGSP